MSENHDRFVPTDLRQYDLPPSAKLVYAALTHDPPFTLQELVEETQLSRRTARYALERLVDHDLVDKRPSLQDARQHRFRPNEE